MMAAVAQITEERPQLGLTFARAPSGETYLKRQYARFPFHVTQPFQLAGGVPGEATVILQALGAGLVRGDRIEMDITVEAGAKAHLTTQGSTIAHAMPDGRAEQGARVVVGEGASLHYLPRPMILFADAAVTTRLEITVHESAQVLWCDGYLTHDTEKNGGRFTGLDAETMLCRDTGELLALDRFVLDGATPDAPGVMAGFPVHAGFGCHGYRGPAEIAERLVSAMADDDTIYSGVSTLPDEQGLFGRILARDGVALRRAMSTVREIVAASA